MNLQILELIQIVNNNYKHIEQLETLGILLSNASYYDEKDLSLYEMIAKTTQNSHYDYKLYTSSVYQNPENHVDVVFKREYIKKHGEQEFMKWYCKAS